MMVTWLRIALGSPTCAFIENEHTQAALCCMSVWRHCPGRPAATLTWNQNRALPSGGGLPYHVFLMLEREPQHRKQRVGTPAETDRFVDGVDLVVVVVVGIRAVVGFDSDRHGALDAFDSGRQLVARDHASFGQLTGVRLAGRFQYGQSMLGKHQDFGGRFGMKDDEHDCSSHNGHGSTLTEHRDCAKKEDAARRTPASFSGNDLRKSARTLACSPLGPFGPGLAR